MVDSISHRFAAGAVSSALIVFAMLFAGNTAQAGGSAGEIDTAFLGEIGTGPTRTGGAAGTVYVTTEQPDGKILVGGLFEFWGSQPVGDLVRLNANGSLDTEFTTNNGTGPSHKVNEIIVQPDGKILIAGTFRTFNGTTAERIARLNQDGSLDSGFATKIGAGANNSATSLALQSDGKILLGGAFTVFDGQSVPRIVRLASDGTVDTAFLSAVGTGSNGSTIRALSVQSDGKILVGGDFTSWDSTTGVGGITRLNGDGSLDTAFGSAIGTGSDGSIRSLEAGPGGQILVGGKFSNWDSTAVGGVVRLSSDGSLDTAFASHVGTGVGTETAYGVMPMAAGKIAVTGTFATWNSKSAGYVALLNADGTQDLEFASAAGAAGNKSLYPATQLANGFMVFAGEMTSWDSTPVPAIVKLGGGSGSGGGGFSASIVVVPDVIQQYQISTELALGSPETACQANAPSHVIDDRMNAERQFEAWRVSYAAWPNNGEGGYVCNRTLSYQSGTHMWHTSGSTITGSGQLQQYAINPSVTERTTSDSNISATQARINYCTTEAPNNPDLGTNWGQRNEGWSPSFATWMNNGTGGWVCSRTL